MPEEDVKLTQEIRDVDKRYKDLYTHVHELAVTYQACKNHFVLRSYGELKRMIKACTTDEVMQCVAQCRADQEAEEKGEAVSSAATETTARTSKSKLEMPSFIPFKLGSVRSINWISCFRYVSMFESNMYKVTININIIIYYNTL